jgi:hypothetical protein
MGLLFFTFIIMHFRQDPLITKHLVETQGSFTHTYNGKEYDVNPDTLGLLDEKTLQSISTRLSKLYPKPPAKLNISRDEGKASISVAPGYDDRVVEKINKEILIEKELKRLATTEILVEDKLHYPRVFMKLLSQPHLALEEKRLVPDEKTELYLYVDEAVGYNDRDNGFHNTMVKVAKKIKGITVYASCMLRFDGDYYWEHIIKNVPKGKTVLVFTQGCGGTIGQPPKGYNIHFCTHFKHGYNCGCGTIRTHESHEKLFKFHYGLDTPETLKSLVIK